MNNKFVHLLDICVGNFDPDKEGLFVIYRIANVVGEYGSGETIKISNPEKMITQLFKHAVNISNVSFFLANSQGAQEDEASPKTNKNEVKAQLREFFGLYIKAVENHKQGILTALDKKYLEKECLDLYKPPYTTINKSKEERVEVYIRRAEAALEEGSGRVRDYIKYISELDPQNKKVLEIERQISSIGLR